MAIDRFFIAPFDKNSGIQTDFKPFAIPDTAFAQLNNAYVFRGRVRKRFGSQWLGQTQQETRLRIQVGVTTAQALSGTVPGVKFRVGQMFSVNNILFTVNAVGTPATMLVANGTATVKTYNTTTGAFAFTGLTDASTTPIPNGTAVYFYPADPVMGLVSQEQSSINLEKTIAFDTQFAYQYNNGWERLATEVTGGASLWTGDDAEFFWGTTFGGADAFNYDLYVTNYNENEPNFMRVLQPAGWNNFRPQISATGPIYLDSCRIIVPFKGRLVAFNTWENEGGTQRNYPFRVRWANIGNPLAADAWRQDVTNRGFGLDLSNRQAIIAVEFVKDRCIIFAEASTWELAYTGNNVLPFELNQLNTELGAESTFSVIPFDRVALGVGNLGIMACNGSNVERIDNNIPDEIFEIHNVDAGVERVCGIRDYYVEMVYWAIPNQDASAIRPYPTQVLVYNYKNNTWAVNDDSITAFGYFQFVTTSPTASWDSQEITWDDDISWGDTSTAARFKSVIAGNQEGWTFIIDPDEVTNAAVLQITDITPTPGYVNRFTISCVNHNLRLTSFIYIKGVVDNTVGTNLTILNNKIFKVLSDASGTLQPNSFDIDLDEDVQVPGTYAGGGVMARITNPDIWTKQYGFYTDQGRKCAVHKVDFLVNRTQFAQATVDFYVSTSLKGSVDDSRMPPLGTGSLLGTNVLEMFPIPAGIQEGTQEDDQEQLWHPVYFQAGGNYVQFRIYMTDAQTERVEEVTHPSGGTSYVGTSLEDFTIHQFVIHARSTSSRL